MRHPPCLPQQQHLLTKAPTSSPPKLLPRPSNPTAPNNLPTSSPSHEYSNLATTSTNNPHDPQMAFHILMQSRILCTNSTHDFDTLDCFTDDWDLAADRSLRDRAMAIHLHCECAAEECKAMADICGMLLNYASNNATQPQISQQQRVNSQKHEQQTNLPTIDPYVFAELQVRQENAIEEVLSLINVLDALATRRRDADEMALPEMGMRAQRLLGKLEGLRPKINALQGYAHQGLGVGMIQGQEQVQVPQDDEDAAPYEASQSPGSQKGE